MNKKETNSIKETSFPMNFPYHSSKYPSHGIPYISPLYALSSLIHSPIFGAVQNIIRTNENIKDVEDKNINQ